MGEDMAGGALIPEVHILTSKPREAALNYAGVKRQERKTSRR